MLSSLDAVVEEYFATTKESKRMCFKELEEMRVYLLEFNGHFGAAYLELVEDKKLKKKLWNSLANVCYLESCRSSAHILFFSIVGLYRNAIDCLRHMLEFIVQGVYLDTRHPDIGINTKIAILRETEGKFEYHTLRLIDNLDINFKDKLKHEYKALSQIVHPSHKQIMSTIGDVVGKQDFHAVPVDCQQIARVLSSVKMTYDMFFYLLTFSLPEIVPLLRKNQEFLDFVRRAQLPLLVRLS